MNKIFFLLVATFFFSNSSIFSVEKNRPKVIGAEEKKELEKRFAGLKTFYIADDGTVVFYKIKKINDAKAKQPAAQIDRKKKIIPAKQQKTPKDIKSAE